MSGSEVTLTIINALTGASDAIRLSLSTSVSGLKEVCCPLLGFEELQGVAVTVEGRALGASGTLADAGVKSGDVLAFHGGLGGYSGAATTSAAAGGGGGGGGAGGGGGLDFSALLGGSSGANGGGGSFASSLSSRSALPRQPVSAPNMSLDALIASNPDPLHFVTLLLSKEHINCLKEMRFHNPPLAAKLSESANLEEAKLVWQAHVVKSSISEAHSKTSEKAKEMQMERRLMQNPMDAEANKYFGEKIRLKNVHEQYVQMMDEFPESMGRVLMLYISTKINNKPQVAFVDSGAQTTIMSYKCAEKLEILHLVDERFAGTAVGVGSAKILGKVHLASMAVEGVTFQVTITVMDKLQGLGDQNMDFLLGLDMLKRHRCKINLTDNVLEFATGGLVKTPFLQEYQLEVSKGGTMGFDADKANKEVEDMIEDAKMKREEKDDEKKKGGGTGGQKEAET